MVYFPFRQVPRGNMALLAQSTAESASLLPGRCERWCRRWIASVPAYDAQTMEAFYAARVTSIGTVLPA